jgi:prepilin-type N-terminal cleavage/methylation domain-containing protein/prepilin-type processing-associated H-X9-DG protein
MKATNPKSKTIAVAPVHSGHQRGGFTLVELLVVIGIIALLISILLPALSKARRSANTLACLANLRSIAQGMQMYASQNSGAFPGSVNTSARFLWGANGRNYDDNNCPTVVQDWDWQSPILTVMGMNFNAGPAPSDRLERYQTGVNFKGFRCPENQFLADAYGGSTLHIPTSLLNSYNTAAIFHYLPAPALPDQGASAGVEYAASFNQLPAGYAPKLSAIGNSAEKIYVADGARYSNMGTSPDVDLAYKGGYGGGYADVGSFSAFSNSWNRIAAPGNSDLGLVPADPRRYAFRHGRSDMRGPAGSYLFNAAFFDGHAETLDDLTGSNPVYWMPRGTKVTGWATEAWPDVVAKWPANSGSDFVCP